MNMITNTALTYTERAKYAPESFDRDCLADCMAELEEWRDLDYGDPDDCKAMVEELESNQENPDHADYDDLKDFFDDTISQWHDTLASGRWPCAEAYDNDLRRALFDDMQKGADAISMIESFLAGDASRDDMAEFFKGLTSC